jgi:hypothetical protein
LSWAPAITDSGQWVGNALRFATKEEAEKYVVEIFESFIPTDHYHGDSLTVIRHFGLSFTPFQIILPKSIDGVFCPRIAFEKIRVAFSSPPDQNRPAGDVIGMEEAVVHSGWQSGRCRPSLSGGGGLEEGRECGFGGHSLPSPTAPLHHSLKKEILD